MKYSEKELQQFALASYTTNIVEHEGQSFITHVFEKVGTLEEVNEQIAEYKQHYLDKGIDSKAIDGRSTCTLNLAHENDGYGFYKVSIVVDSRHPSFQKAIAEPAIETPREAGEAEAAVPTSAKLVKSAGISS